MHKLARVVSYLAAAEQRPIQGAITRAFALPDLVLARAALLQIHTQLQSLNCSAALRLLRDPDRSLTFHQSGVYDRLSGSLHRTQRVVRAVQQLNRRVRGNWLPPTSRRALLHFCWRRWKYACTEPRMLQFILDAKQKLTGKNENKSIGDSDSGDLCQPYACGKRYRWKIMALVYPRTLPIHGPFDFSTT